MLHSDIAGDVRMGSESDARVDLPTVIDPGGGHGGSGADSVGCGIGSNHPDNRRGCENDR